MAGKLTWLHPRDGSNGDLDPDMDGWDADGDGVVVYFDLISSASVIGIDVEIGEFVFADDSIIRAQITLAGGNYQTVVLAAPVDGYVYGINVEIGQVIESRLFEWAVVVEPEEDLPMLWNTTQEIGTEMV